VEEDIIRKGRESALELAGTFVATAELRDECATCLQRPAALCVQSDGEDV
jgi:hypothetical protein